MSETARNAADKRSYDNCARYDDEAARTPLGWRYTSRHYRFYHLDLVEGRLRSDPAEVLAPPATRWGKP